VGRNSDTWGGKAEESICMSQVGERKGQKLQYVIIKYINPQQTIGGPKIIDKCYCMLQMG